MEQEQRLVEVCRTLDVNFNRLIELPKGEQEFEWIAYHMSLFFKHTKRLSAVTSSFCTAITCPSMSISEDKDVVVRVVETEEGNCDDLDCSDISTSTPEEGHSMSALEYTDSVLSWYINNLRDPELFPVESAHQYPEDFKARCRHMLRRLLHIYFHIYFNHFGIVFRHFLLYYNTSFRYMVEFGMRYDILRDEDLLPMTAAIKYWKSAA